MMAPPFSEDDVAAARWFLSYARNAVGYWWPRELLQQRFKLTDSQAGELLQLIKGGVNAADAS
ncbi:hypothetical protein EN741_27450 [Mesorhizobium sp. M4B.F.Ca.ET.019.03.1.1]|uniref:hypothetical protein n=1 Tax=Mesorhizobium sp. M4B.F.Ca.ET.019.03.1.1 TaxID=2496651 RepID=UPI000FCC72D1|nr:hypothetical protein [Mesorhizobium sp. M4B.F.Ca.ET.019.03.1.1]RVD35621.1 hypothetical protein EN741_27450 [Mesorhizobium sp. M4B.F.Ca.ET.019.03.1.1]